jgi:predicted porin
MKKLLLALALSAAFTGATQAQSSVSVYGIMDGSYTQAENSSKTTAGGATTNTKSHNTVNGDGALSTSRLGFRGNEDLGGGKSAQFVLEYDLINIGNGGNGTDTGLAQSSNTNGRTEGFGARYSWIGLTDKNLGALRIGRQESSMHGAFTNGLAGQANNMTGSVYSSSSATTSTNANVISAAVRPYDVFVDQAITYVAPTMSGFSAQVQYSQNAYSAGSTTPSAGFQQAGASIRYTGVKNLTVAYGFQQDNAVVANTSNAKRVVNALSANYDFGPVTAFGVYSTHENTNLSSGAVTRDQKATELGLRAPISKAMEVWASTFMGTKTESTNSATLTATTTGNANLKGIPQGYLSVFIPTVPNPTSGFHLMVKETEVVESGMKVDDAFKLILSLGVATPNE